MFRYVEVLLFLVMGCEGELIIGEEISGGLWDVWECWGVMRS